MKPALQLGGPVIGPPCGSSRTTNPEPLGETVGPRAADHRDLVDAFRELREKIGHLHPGLAAFLENPPGTEQGAEVTRLKHRLIFIEWHLLAMPLDQLRFGIKQIDLAGSAIHEQENNVPGFRRKMWRLGRERRGRGGRRFFRRAGEAAEETVLRQHRRQGRPHESAAGLPEKFPARPAARRAAAAITKTHCCARHSAGWPDKM